MLGFCPQKEGRQFQELCDREENVLPEIENDKNKTLSIRGVIKITHSRITNAGSEMLVSYF